MSTISDSSSASDESGSGPSIFPIINQIALNQGHRCLPGWLGTRTTVMMTIASSEREASKIS